MIPRLPRSAYFLPWALCLSFGTSCFGADAGQPARILWAGSSSIYYHGQPKVCAQWLAQLCGKPAISDLVGRSGTGVHVYLRPDFKPEYGLKPGQTILQRIAAERYDYVVLQVPAEFINGPEGEQHHHLEKSLGPHHGTFRGAPQTAPSRARAVRFGRSEPGLAGLRQRELHTELRRPPRLSCGY